MKSNFTFLSVAASLLLTSSLFAVTEDYGESTSLLVNQTASTVVSSTTKVNLDTANASASLGAQSLIGSNIKVINIPISYALTDGFAAHVNIPLVQNRAAIDTTGNFSTETGMGDISLAGSYNFGKVDGYGKSDIKVQYKSSTGGDLHDGLGSGSENITYSYAYFKSSNGYDYNADFSYIMNSISDATFFGNTLEYGDAYQLFLSASHASWIIPQSTTSLKLSYSDTSESTTTGTGIGGGGDGNGLTSTDLWLEWKNTTWIPFTPIAFGLKIPLAQDTEANALAEKKYLFYLTIDSPFM